MHLKGGLVTMEENHRIDGRKNKEGDNTRTGWHWQHGGILKGFSGTLKVIRNYCHIIERFNMFLVDN